MESINVIGILVPHLPWSSDFHVFLWQVHTHPMTTPTRSMARMAHSPPSPPPSFARLGQDSIPPCILPSALSVASIMVFGLAVVCEADDGFTPIMGVVSSSLVGMVLSIVGVVSSIIRVVTFVPSLSAEDEM